MKRFSAAVLIAIWAFLLLGGAYVNRIVNQRSFDASSIWIAANAMPANHQIMRSDLAKPLGADESQMPDVGDLLGRYLMSPKSADDPIVPADLSLTPNLAYIEGDDGAHLYPLVGDEIALTELLDVGSQIRLCAAESGWQQAKESENTASYRANCFDQALEVLAVHRETEESPGNWIMLKFPAIEADEFGQYVAAEKRFLVITSENPQKAP
jgi:hypothetical protein